MSQWERISLPTQELQELSAQSLGRKDLAGGKKWQPIAAFLPRKFYAQGSLSCYRPWGQKRAGPSLVAELATGGMRQRRICVHSISTIRLVITPLT